MVGNCSIRFHALLIPLSTPFDDVLPCSSAIASIAACLSIRSLIGSPFRLPTPCRFGALLFAQMRHWTPKPFIFRIKFAVLTPYNLGLCRWQLFHSGHHLLVKLIPSSVSGTLNFIDCIRNSFSADGVIHLSPPSCTRTCRTIRGRGKPRTFLCIHTPHSCSETHRT